MTHQRRVQIIGGGVDSPFPDVFRTTVEDALVTPMLPDSVLYAGNQGT